MALLDANVPCNDYFPGHYSTKDTFDPEGSTWTSSNVYNELRADRHQMVSFPVPSPCTPLEYNKELLKQTILKQEAIFKHQIHELHRVYHKQRELMDGIKRNEFYKHNLRLEAPQSSSVLPSENTQKTFCLPSLPWSSAQSSVLMVESVELLKGKSRQVCPVLAAPALAEESKHRNLGKNLLDLQLPADEYIGSKEGEENERVIEVPQVSAYSLTGTSQVVRDSQDKSYGTSSRGFSDLNVPFKPEEEAATKSYDLRGPKHYWNNHFFDPSRTKFGFQNLPNGVVQNLNNRQDLEALSNNLLPLHEKKHEWLSSGISTGQSCGLLDSSAKDQINRGPWIERNFSSSESSAQTQHPNSNGLFGPSSGSNTCALPQLVSGAHMLSSEISPAELWKTFVSHSGQSQLAIQASSASSGQIPKSFIGIPGFNGDEIYQGSSVKLGPTLDNQNRLLSYLGGRSKLLDLPSLSTNGPNNPDDHGSLDCDEIRKRAKGSEDVGTPNNLNLNIVPVGCSDSTAFQSIHITGEENKSQDSSRGLSWLKEKPIGKGKPNEEKKISTQSEVFPNQSKNQTIEEIEKNYISDDKPPSIEVHDSGEQVPAGEHLMKNDQKKHESFAGLIDLNSSIMEDENMPIEVNSHAPASPENKECLPPRGESEENQPEMPSQLIEQEDPVVQEEKQSQLTEQEDPQAQEEKQSQLTEQEDPEAQEEKQIRIVAEALVSISGLRARKDVQATTCSTSEPFLGSPLHWFAGIVSAPENHPEKEIEADFSSKANDPEGFLPAKMDYFEFMTLKLAETKVQDCFYESKGQTEKVGGSTPPTQPRKGSRTNRGRWRRRKDFQSEILPSLASLSRHEVTEDLQTIGSLVSSSAHSEAGSQRSAGRNALCKRRRRSCTSTSTKLGIEKRGLVSWGKTCKKPRGKRLPTSNPKLLLSLSI